MEVHRFAKGPHYQKVHHQNNLIQYLVNAAKPVNLLTIFAVYLCFRSIVRLSLPTTQAAN